MPRTPSASIPSEAGKSGSRCRVAVLGPRPLERGAIRTALEGLAGFRVVVSAERVEDLLVACKRGEVVDLALEYLSDADAAADLAVLRTAHPELGLVALGAGVDPRLTHRAYCAGARAVLDLLEAGEGELQAAAKDVAGGHLHVNGVMDRMLRDRGPGVKRSTEKERPRLTPAEHVILHWMANRAGYTEREIAEQVGSGPSTVHTHIKSIYRKLGAHSHRQALRLAEHYHLLDL